LIGSGVFFSGNSANTNNLIEGNQFFHVAYGVSLDGPGNTAQGNTFTNTGGIGINVSQNNNLVMSNAISGANQGIVASSSGNTISGNTVNGNAIGVEIDQGNGNTISVNSIYANTGNGGGISASQAGIVLQPGANNNQAAPVLTSAIASVGDTTVIGTLNSVGSTTFRIEFFANAPGSPQGQTFLGAISVLTDPSGQAAISTSALTALPAGQHYFTATATNLSTGDTSQFSNAILVTPTITVSGGPFTYDDTAHSAIGHAIGLGGASIGGSFSFTYNGSSVAPTDAGTYGVVATFTSTDLGYGNASGTGTITINVAAPNVTVNGGSFTYDAKWHAASATATGVGGAIVYGGFAFTYNGSSTIPTNAGTYHVVASFTSANPNYSNAAGTGSITIDPATPAMTVTGGTFTYDGTVHSATASTGFLAQPYTVNQFTMPTPNAGPYSGDTGAVGTDGNVWFVEQTINSLARITPAGQVTEIPIPAQLAHGSIAFGPDGNIWLGSLTDIGEVSPQGTLLRDYVIPSMIGASIDNLKITLGPDGNIWYVEPYTNDIVGRLTPGGQITEYNIGMGPWGAAGIIAGPDGNLWFEAVLNSESIGRITPSGMVTTFDTSTSGFPSALAGGRGITAGPDGNIWFDGATSDPAINAIYRMSTAGQMTGEFPVPTANSGTYGMTVGSDGALWFTELGADQIGRITTSGQITNEIPIPPSGPYGTILTGADGNLWFNNPSGNAVDQFIVPSPATTASGSFTFTYNGSPTAPTHAGTYNVVATFTSSDSNYTGSTGTATLIINQAAPTITVSGGPFIYDGNQQTATATATGVGGATIHGSFTFTYDGSSTAPTNAKPSGYAVVATFTSSDGNYTGSNGTGTLIINQATPTIKVSGGPYTYDGNQHTATATATGVGGATVSGSLTLTYDGSSTAPTNAKPNGYAVEATFISSDSNYTSNSGTGTLIINQATPTIEVSGGPYIYDGNQHLATATATGIGGAAVTGTFTFTYDGSSTAPTNAKPSGYAVVSTFTSGDGNYTGSNGAGTLIINQATPSIMVNGGTFTYDGHSHPATATALGVGGATVSGSFTFTYNGSNTAPTNVGSYAVVGTFTSTNSNYTGNTGNGTLVITPASTSTAISAPTVTVGLDGMVTVSVSSSASTVIGSVSLSVDGGSPVSHTLSGGAWTFDVGNLAVGNHSLSASYAAQGNFGSSSATGTLTVTLGNTIVILNGTAAGALTLSGNAGIQIAGPLDVDSSSASAITASGNSHVSAGAINVVGHVQTSGSASLSPAPAMGASYVADPLAGLPVPDSSNLLFRGPVNLNGNHTQTIDPGIYTQISVSGNAQLIMNCGIYVIGGGGFTVTGSGSVTGSGVMIYNAGASGSFGALTLSGNGNVNITPATTGTYAGILIFQSRDNTQTMALTGSSVSLGTGSVYAAAATLNLSGNVQFQGSFIVGKMNISGSAVAQLSATNGAIAYSAAQIRGAYGINNVALDGTGQTIAIVEAYDDPSILQAVDAFDQQFSLTDTGSTLYELYGSASSFVTVVNQDGQSAPLPSTDPTGGWEEETALDVQWTHAMAPGARIIVVEANSQALADLMAGVVSGANQPQVSVVSMSWGLPEGRAVFQQDEAAYDGDFTTPAGHQPVTFIASTGDYGTADPEYPAYSPNVVAVGGTSLYLNADNSYQSETGWGYYSNDLGDLIGSGGGTSLYEPEPYYQHAAQSSGNRSTPDVSIVADPNTGAWIADPWNQPADNPWKVVGGTSLSAPCWAGLMAVVNQGRANAGEATLSSSGGVEAQAGLYGLPAAAFNSITTGSNGNYTAQAGYNMVTGLGTPVAGVLVPGLIAYQTVSPANTTVSAPATAGTGNSGGPDSIINVFNVFNLVNTGSPGTHAAFLTTAPAAERTNQAQPEPLAALHTQATDAVMAEWFATSPADGQIPAGPLPQLPALATPAVAIAAMSLDQVFDDADLDWLQVDKSKEKWTWDN
jgi:parallel beta-helix repeat protein